MEGEKENKKMNTEIVNKMSKEINAQLSAGDNKDNLVTKESVVKAAFPNATEKEKRAYMVILGAVMDLGLLPEFQSIKRVGIKPASYVPKNSVMLTERAERTVEKAKKAAERILKKAEAKEIARKEKAIAREIVREAKKAEKAAARNIAREAKKAEKAAAMESAKETKKAEKITAKKEKAEKQKKPERALHPAHQK